MTKTLTKRQARRAERVTNRIEDPIHEFTLLMDRVRIDSKSLAVVPEVRRRLLAKTFETMKQALYECEEAAAGVREWLSRHGDTLDSHVSGGSGGGA